MVSRSELDMLDIREIFRTKYEKSLYSMIKVSGRWGGAVCGGGGLPAETGQERLSWRAGVSGAPGTWEHIQGSQCLPVSVRCESERHLLRKGRAGS